MNKTVPPITESTLRTDLNDLASSLVREMAMATRKLSIYGHEHPMAVKAVARPFVFMSQIFRFRTIINFNLHRGFLYLYNIRLKDDVFTGEIIQLMQTQDIHSFLLRSEITSEEFTTLMDRLVRRLPPRHKDYDMAAFVQNHGLNDVEVNTETAVALFEERKQYRGDVAGDFSIKRIALDMIGEDLGLLAGLSEASEEQLFERLIDFRPSIVSYVIPEKVVKTPAERIRKQLNSWAAKISSGDDTDSGRLGHFMSIMKLIEDHPDRERIVADLDHEVMSTANGSDTDERSHATGQIRIASQKTVEDLLSQLFGGDGSREQMTMFADAFERLIKTGQQDQAASTVTYLLNRMTDTSPNYRQMALDLLTSAIDALPPEIESGILRHAVRGTLHRLEAHEETFEFSELLGALFRKCMQKSRFDLMAELTEGMATRRQIEGGVAIYDSMAVKKGFENINSARVISSLVSTLLNANHETAETIKRVMVAIGSEDIAFALAEIIAHPIRHVRQLALRILADMGKAALNVFTRILNDDSWFERNDDSRELPNAKWYVVRNSIFVLGSLNDTDGIVPLRLRLNDPDFRVRREIVTALEKIGGEEAVDLLVLMANDPIHEISERAVIAVGLVGNAEAAPLLIDAIKRNLSVAVKAIYALGKLGGEEACAFLTNLLEDESAFNDLVAGQVSKDDLRVAIVKSLGAIGDARAINSVRTYRENLSTTQKIFFKNSPVQKTISDILHDK